jgi:hypothetical protein
LSQTHEIAVEIGGQPILLRTQDPLFREMLAHRYAGFVGTSTCAGFTFDIDLVAPRAEIPEENLRLETHDGVWRLRRGDFWAEWDPRRGRGRVQQSAYPHAIDSVLRIVHTLLLARQGGFLLHAASSIRGDRAFLFSGASGAGKTTLSRLAPPDAKLLTDEISYIRRDGDAYRACGTPFTGELELNGENCSAPIAALFFLKQGPENRMDPIGQPEAARSLLRNILFFAEDAELVKEVFRSACRFVERIPVRRLTFVPDEKVWEMIA